jgi:hypothetical protein
MGSLNRVEHDGNSTATYISTPIPSKQLLCACEEENILNVELNTIGRAD